MNIKIQKYNHVHIIIKCEKSIAAEINDYFTFQVEGYKFMPAYRKRKWDGKIHIFDMNKHLFPAGLIFELIKFLDKRGYKYELEDSDYGLPISKEEVNIEEVYKYIKELKLPFEIKDYQFLAVMKCLRNKRGIILSSVGSGKSLIIYVLMRYFIDKISNKQKVLVIVPTTNLVEQMYNDFKHYGIDETDVHRIYSGREKNTKCNVVISTWQSIYKMDKDWYEQFGMVLGDECHGFKAKSLSGIMNNSTQAEYRYGTTGTLDGIQINILVLQGLFGKIFTVSKTKDLQDKGILAGLNIKRIVLKYPKEDIRECENIKAHKGEKNKRIRKYQKEIDYIISHKKRNKFISKLAIDQKGNSLVLFNFVEKHGKPLFELIKNGADENRKVFFVSGSVEINSRELIREIVEKEDNAIIVASLGTFSTGINIRNLHNIILSSPTKSQIRLLQSIGRGLRKAENNCNTALYDIIDDLSTDEEKNYAMLHGYERQRIYKNENFNFKTYEVKI